MVCELRQKLALAGIKVSFSDERERERETDLIHLSRRVADKDKRKQESTTEHQKSLCLNLYKTARKENVTVHGLVLARVRLAPEGVNRNVSYNGGALGLPAGVSTHMGRTVFLNDTPKKREEPNPHTGQRYSPGSNTKTFLKQGLYNSRGEFHPSRYTDRGVRSEILGARR